MKWVLVGVLVLGLIIVGFSAAEVVEPPRLVDNVNNSFFVDLPKIIDIPTKPIEPPKLIDDLN